MNRGSDNRQATRRFKVGDLLVEPQLNQLTGADGAIHVEARSMDVLVALADRAGDVLSRAEILEQIWGERIVGEEVLTHAIWDLRRGFEDDPKTPRFIQTVRGRGYRLVAAVSWLELAVGTHERYDVCEQIGAGAFGVIHRAKDRLLQRDVALKFLPPELSRLSEAKAQFMREARAAAALDHPNICTLYEVSETEDGRMFLVMPLYRGETLKERIARGPIEWSEVAGFGGSIADGLAAAHAASVVHRDIKPSNVFLTVDSQVKILDFGIAKLVDATQQSVSESSQGTPAYMAPELLAGEPAHPGCDLWSIGVLLYESLGGERPFRGAHDQAIIYSIRNEEPPLLSEELSLPAEWSAILDGLLSKAPNERLADAAGLGRRLHALAATARPGEEPATGPPLVEAETPYPGLSSFSREQARYFFGRQLEVEALWEKLQRCSLTAIIGPSGAGKSSFVQAGVLAALPKDWRSVLFHPGTAPLVAFGEAMATELEGDAELMRQLVRFQDPKIAYSTVAPWRERYAEVLIVIDQFEELFILNDAEKQARFAALLGRLTEEAGVRVLLVMRDDFFFGCSSFPELQKVFADVAPLRPPTGDALKEALVDPARSCGYRFEDDALVSEMLGEVKGERGALPLLAFAAAKLWELRDREERMLTREAYQQIGGVGGALAQHAEEILQSLGPERVPLARDLFRNLLTPEGTRAVRDVEDLLSLSPDREAMSEVLTRLVDGRLLTTFESSDSGGKRVEIIHESLLAAWPRLVRWQTQDADTAQLRDQLRRSAKLWEERGRPEEELWTGASYLEFRAWRERASGGLTASEEAFGAAMTHREERRQRRKRKIVGIIVALLLLVIVAVAGLWRRSADEARRALAAEWVARGRIALEEYPTRALAHALASLELVDNPGARRLAVAALAEGPPAQDLGGGWTTVVLAPDSPPAETLTYLDWSALNIRRGWPLLFTPDGEWLVQATHGGWVFAWSRRGGGARQLAKFEQAPALRLEPGVLMASSSNGSRRWSLPDLTPLIELEIDDITHSARGFVYGTPRTAPGGGAKDLRQLEGSGEILRAWPLEGGEPRSLTRVDWDWWTIAHRDHSTAPEFVFLQNGRVYATPVASEGRGPVREIARWQGDISSFWVLEDGSRILTPVEGSTKLVLWSLAAESATGVPAPLLLIDPGEEIWEYRARRDFLVTAHWSSETWRIWSLSDGRPVRPGPLQAPAPIRGFEISLDGEWFAAGGVTTGTFHLFDLAAPADTRAVELKRGAAGLGQAVAFHPDGHWLATGDTSGVAIWPLPDKDATPAVIAAHPAQIRTVAVSPDGTWMASGVSLTNVPVRISFLDDRAARYSPKPIISKEITIGPRGRLFVASWQGLEIVTPGDWRSRFHRGFAEDATSVSIDPMGRRAAVSGGMTPADARIKFWDVESELGSPDIVHTLDSGNMGWVREVAFLPDGRLLSASGVGVQLWDVQAETFEWLLERKHKMRRLGVDESGQIVASVGVSTKLENDAIRVWDRAQGTSWDVTSHGNKLRALHVSPDGKHLISGGLDGAVRVGPITGEEPHLLLGHQGSVWDLDVTPDSAFLVSAGNDGDLRLWPMPKGQPTHLLPYEELLARLRATTNLRLIRDDDEASGYRIEALRFFGWERTPTQS